MKKFLVLATFFCALVHAQQSVIKDAHSLQAGIYGANVDGDNLLFFTSDCPASPPTRVAHPTQAQYVLEVVSKLEVTHLCPAFFFERNTYESDPLSVLIWHEAGGDCCSVVLDAHDRVLSRMFKLGKLWISAGILRADSETFELQVERFNLEGLETTIPTLSDLSVSAMAPNLVQMPLHVESRKDQLFHVDIPPKLRGSSLHIIVRVRSHETIIFLNIYVSADNPSAQGNLPHHHSSN
jgi:hypothetical protein